MSRHYSSPCNDLIFVPHPSGRIIGIPILLLCYDIGMKQLSIAILLLLGSVSLFAQYHAKTVPVLDLESYPARSVVGGITLAADPYPTDDRSFTAFDVRDLNSRGYYPVHIIVKNGTENFVTVKTRNAVLVTAAG